MNKYVISSFTECSLQFNNPKSAQQTADKFGLNVCKIYYLDGHTPRFIGYGLENENGLMNGKEFTYKGG